jgi:hypothetical protein
MRPISSTDELASRQYGVVSRSQLLAAGLHPSRIARELRARRLHRVHVGVYAVGHRSLSVEGRWLAAVLACGVCAVLSHRSGAVLWRLRTSDSGIASVTAPVQLTRPRIETHRGRLATADRTVQRGIPVTSVSRTIVDLGHLLDDESLERVVREAQFRGLWNETAIRDVLSRRSSPRVRAYLGDVAPTQTRLEDRFLRLCDRHGIPRPLTQQGARPRLDFVWPAHRLVVEVDGWESHRTRVAFQQDRTTTNALQLDGFVVLRFTWEDVNRRPAMVAGQIRRALGLP